MEKANIVRRSVLAVLLLSLIATVTAVFVHAATENELTAAREIISILESGDAARESSLERNLASIPDTSTLKPIANHAKELYLIRQGKFPDAMNLIGSASESVKTAASSLRMSHEELLLWLMIEAGNPEPIQKQFQRLTAIAVNPNLSLDDRKPAFGFLGRVMGMLETAGEKSPLGAKMLNDALAQFQAYENESVKILFRSARDESLKWGDELNEAFKQLDSTDIDAFRQAIKTIESDIDKAKSEQSSSRDAIEEKSDQKKSVAADRKTMFQELQSIQDQWRRETPGRPVTPRSPIRPAQPAPKYKYDSKTGEKTVTSTPSRTEMDNYNRRLAEYNRDLEKYNQAVAELPAKIERWTQADAQRRQALTEKKNQVDRDIRELDEALKKSADEMSDAGKEAGKQRRELSLLERKLEIMKIVERQSGDSTKPLIRPSNFHLVDYSFEASRLRKLLKP